MAGAHAQALTHISHLNGMESIIRLFGRRFRLFTTCFLAEYETHTVFSNFYILPFLDFRQLNMPFPFIRRASGHLLTN